VISTGYYVNDAHPSMIIDMNADEIAEIMCREILEGIDDTGIKAGVIGEIGVGFQMMNNERKVLEASAIANRRTGRPIHVHINPWSRAGIEASELLLNAGVDPNRICINHVDVKNDEEYIYSLLRKGVFIEFDNFGKEYYIDRQARNQRYDHFAHDTERVALLKKLICDGYSSQILLSCDVCLKSLLHAYGGWGYDHVLTNILPMMEDAGIDKSTVDSMLIDNPAYFLDDRLSL
jgi:phosphotriesterase-related protein